MSKFLEVLKSKNALVTFFNIIFGLIVANEVAVNVSPEQAADALFGQDFLQIATYVVLNFLNVFTKIGEKFAQGKWSWSWLKSSNFWTQVLTVVALVIGSYFGEVVAGFVVTIIINAINLFLHLKAPAKNNIVIDDIIGG